MRVGPRCWSNIGPTSELSRRWVNVGPTNIATWDRFHTRSTSDLQKRDQIDGLVQERRNSSALAMELRLSCTNPSRYTPWPHGGLKMGQVWGFRTLTEKVFIQVISNLAQGVLIGRVFRNDLTFNPVAKYLAPWWATIWSNLRGWGGGVGRDATCHAVHVTCIGIPIIIKIRRSHGHLWHLKNGKYMYPEITVVILK